MGRGRQPLGQARGFGRRKLWVSLPVGIVFSFVIYIIFGRFLQLSLPAGPLILILTEQ